MGNRFCTSCEQLVRLGLVRAEFYAKEFVRSEWIIVSTLISTYLYVHGCYVDRRRRENRGAIGAKGDGMRGGGVPLPGAKFAK